MKNDVFNGQRFLLLCRKEWAENWRGKLWLRMAFPTLILIVILWWNYYLYCRSVENGHSLPSWELLLYACCFFVFYGVWVTGTMMWRVGDRKSRVGWLLTPASALEKFLLSLIGVLVSIFLIFPLALGVEEVLRVAAFSALYPGIDVRFIDFSQLIGDGTRQEWALCKDIYQFWDGILIGVTSFSILTLGATLWPKGAMMRTLIACAGVAIVYNLVLYGAVWLFLPQGPQSMYEITRGMRTNDEGLLRMLDWPWIRLYLIAGVTPFCFILAYFRFKEMEIINRW